MLANVVVENVPFFNIFKFRILNVYAPNIFLCAQSGMAVGKTVGPG